MRLATTADSEEISELMRASVRGLFPGVYSAAQTASAQVYIAHLDPVLIDDGTYYVHEQGGDLVACGGWSRRAKLYSGSTTQGDDLRLLDPATEPARIRAMFVHPNQARRGLGRALLQVAETAAAAAGFRHLILMATMPGVPLYAAYGFAEVERLEIPIPDGTTVTGALMTRAILGTPDLPAVRPR